MTDLHIHTNKSKCANPSMTLENIVTNAVNRRLEGIGITDHWHPITDKSIFFENREEISDLGNSPLTIWLGVEADVLNLEGTIVGEEQFDIPVDYVVAGVHHFHLPWVDGPKHDEPLEKALYKAHRQVLAALHNPLVNALAHPWSGIAKYAQNGGFRFDFDYVRVEWLEEEAHAAKEFQKPLEVPTWALINKDGTTNAAFLSAIVRPLIKFGCPLYIGTDAHEPHRVGAGVQETLGILLSEGATKEQLWFPTATLFRSS